MSLYECVEIDGYKHTIKGTELHIVIPKKSIGDDLKRFSSNGIVKAELRIDDNRTITAEQRKKAYATIRDIADYTGHEPEFLKEYFKYSLISKSGVDYFSLSNCSVSIAREFINVLIEFCVQWGVILTDGIINRTDDIDRAIYYCLVNRTCIITGQPNADIHHCTGSRVGMGGNRKKINNRGRYLLPLNRKWHEKLHIEGERKIFDKFKIYGLCIDDEALKKLGLNMKEIEETERIVSLKAGEQYVTDRQEIQHI